MRFRYDPDCPPPALFILGAPRSGTSWLYRLLCLHRGAAWISNYLRRTPFVPEVAMINRLAYAAPGLRENIWFPGGDAYVYGRRRRVLERAFPAPVEGEPVFVRTGAVPGAGSAFDAAELRRAVHRLLVASGSDVFVSKRITHNRRVPELRRAFPDARFIHLLRDGRQVARSLERVDWWPSERLWWRDGRSVAACVRDGADLSELAARHWVAEVTAVRHSLAAVDSPFVRTVRYEDLVRGGLPAFEDVLVFAGLEPTDAWRACVRAVLERPRPSADPPASVPAVVADVQAGELARLGYVS